MKKIFSGLFFGLILIGCVEENDLLYDRDAWIGQWTCNEVEGDFAPQTYPVDIVERVGEGNVSVRGLYNEGVDMALNATIVGQSIEIPQQTEDGISYVGNGSINDDLDEITLYFTANDGSGDDNVKAVLYR